MLLKLVEPFLNIPKWFVICKWKYKQNSLAPLKIRFSNCFESLLASCVPDLKILLRGLLLYRFNFEVNAKGWCEIILIEASDIAVDKASFTNPWVTKHNNFDIDRRRVPSLVPLFAGVHILWKKSFFIKLLIIEFRKK